MTTDEFTRILDERNSLEADYARLREDYERVAAERDEARARLAEATSALGELRPVRDRDTAILAALQDAPSAPLGGPQSDEQPAVVVADPDIDGDCDMTEDEFDAAFAAGEPVTVIGRGVNQSAAQTIEQTWPTDTAQAGTGANLGTGGPLAVMPRQSGHGDVHTLEVGRTNGDSLTVEEYRRVFAAVTGRQLTDDEINGICEWFAEEDR